MNGLDKIFLTATVLMAIAVAMILMIPDASGQSVFQALSPVTGMAGAYFERTLASLELKLAAWTDSLQAWVRQTGPQSSSSRDQGNPVDSAVGPMGSYGEEQKDEFGKPLEGLQP
jgi:hypothetical protein